MMANNPQGTSFEQALRRRLDVVACCSIQFWICAWHRVSNPKEFSISVLLLQLRIEIYCKTMERQVIIDHG